MIVRILTALLLALPLAVVTADWDPPAYDLSWEPPTERVDGTPIDPTADIAHYVLYCGIAEEGPFETVAYEIPGQAEEGAHEVLMGEVFPEYGEYYCRMTAVDNDGFESDYSPETVMLVWDVAPPRAPTQLLRIRLEG